VIGAWSERGRAPAGRGCTRVEGGGVAWQESGVGADGGDATLQRCETVVCGMVEVCALAVVGGTNDDEETHGVPR